MSALDILFFKREKKYRRNYEIDDKLYSELEPLSRVYEASVNDLINASIYLLIKSEDVTIYKKSRNEISVTHTLLIRESNIAGLEHLKERYGISIYRLVNIAIKNMLAGK